MSNMGENTAQWVLPDKWSDDILDEFGNKMSKR